MTKVVAELPDELVATMKRLARQLGITEKELLAQGLQQYCQTLESDFKAIGFGMWQEREDLKDSAQWVRNLRECEWQR